MLCADFTLEYKHNKVSLCQHSQKNKLCQVLKLQQYYFNCCSNITGCPSPHLPLQRMQKNAKSVKSPLKCLDCPFWSTI